MSLRAGALIGSVALIIATSAAAVVASKPIVAHFTVPCARAVGSADGSASGMTVVGGAIAVPAGYMPRAVHNPPTHPWRDFPSGLPWWRKSGVQVRTGADATVTVPRAWRRRVAVMWGFGTDPSASTLTFKRCYGLSSRWLWYSGGFFVREPSCIPLVVQAGNVRRRLWFGVGKRC